MKYLCVLLKKMLFLFKFKIFRSIHRRFSLLFNLKYKSVERLDVLFDFDLRHPIDRHIFYNNKYENENFYLFLEKCNNFKPDIFIDVGSNNGVYSLRIKKKIPLIKLLAFEPLESNYKRLKKNFLINGIPKKDFELFCFALSDKNKNLKGKLDTKKNLINSGGFKIDKKGNISIETKKFDSLKNLKSKKLAIKIDVEGHELYALKGMKTNLINNKILLIIEIKKDFFKRVDDYLKNIDFNFISKIGHEDYIYSNYL